MKMMALHRAAMFDHKAVVEYVIEQVGGGSYIIKKLLR